MTCYLDLDDGIFYGGEMFLTPDELIDLTERRYAASQRKWLIKNGYPFDVGAGGHPKVSRSYVERRLGGKITSTRKAPNYSVINDGSPSHKRH